MSPAVASTSQIPRRLSCRANLERKNGLVSKVTVIVVLLSIFTVIVVCMFKPFVQGLNMQMKITREQPNVLRSLIRPNEHWPMNFFWFCWRL